MRDFKKKRKFESLENQIHRKQQKSNITSRKSWNLLLFKLPKRINLPTNSKTTQKNDSNIKNN